MATYLILFKFSQKGLETFKDLPERVQAAEKQFRDNGAEVKGWYLLMGKYDSVTITEAPDDETIARCVLALGSLGNVHSETLRAFTIDEVKKVIDSLP